MPSEGSFEYTITSVNGADLTLSPQFSISPAFCLNSIAPGSFDTGLIPFLSFDESDQILSLSEITDSIDLAGAVETKYEIPTVLSYFDYSGNLVDTRSVSQTLTIKNPCLDPAFVSIS